MKLYLIERVGEAISGYDMNYGHVIAAESPATVRKIAALDASDEGEEVWLDPKKTKVTRIDNDSQLTEGIILTDFNAG